VLTSISEMKEKNVPVKMNNVFFEFDKYELQPESYSELNRLYDILSENPDLKVSVDGHTDIVGTEEYNISLSYKRADAVVGYLIKKGIDKCKCKINGYGSSKPVASNDDEEGRQKNRRVEIRFFK